MKQITAGIVAHVDAGKTTLSEALLYRAGALRTIGRVDNGDAFLDPDALEKARGITIFSHQAHLQFDGLDLTLLDTPGHVDFASQTEQVLRVLDYAVLVVSAADGVQGYTRTLWGLLARYQVPTFIFINKTDVPGADLAKTLAQLQASLAPGCLDFSSGQDALPEAVQENIALQDEAVLADYLETGELATATVQHMIQKRQVFPVYAGAALKLTGVDALMQGLAKWAVTPEFAPEFAARVFKISHDQKGERLTWIRMDGGRLRPKAVLFGTQKVNQLRVYDGEKYQVVPELKAGAVGVLPGLADTYPGMGLGQAENAAAPVIQPVLTYRLDPMAEDLHACQAALLILDDEDPQLHVTWSTHLQEVRVQLMGTVQKEVLQQLLKERFDLTVDFDQGSIRYQETLTAPVEGVGHFEPLRHYAEVHLRMTPGAPGRGLVFDSECSLEVLGRNWQHQVLSSLTAKEHLGVLIGAPLTDLKITLVSGRASNVHSVGGDFREATWRAVRQGLMMQKQAGCCQLLEPWYDFRLVVDQAQVGRALTDIQRMSGTADAPQPAGDGFVSVSGQAPVSEMQGYAQTVRAYTHGRGQLECVVAGYQPCHDQAAVLAASDYDPVGDLPNTPDSVFCAHGAGYPVAWDQVPAMAHVPYQQVK
ncbi:GTP-binding protein [Lacticaseibacillus baoqingensis]|uniref:GTP-binding protein n=1 Tax=Lacticaseibacillus baoqingensis TaxID=2486013 RepID=A0ABW4E4D6_9LACO|nr:TetM/TetW/TetO/TetS family tetracycline resistance ribosomal protection protein [Lacticaseibacillus baoqingensis]